MRLALGLMMLMAAPAAAEPTYGLSLLGPPKLPADFAHFPYANPDAPKGGTVVRAASGSFDSFNSFVVRGSPAVGIGQIYDSLLANDDDRGLGDVLPFVPERGRGGGPFIRHLHAAAGGEVQ